jgi:hypothetical protein
VNPFESFPRQKRLSLRAISVALGLIAALFALCPSLSAADGEDLSRDLANPFSSLWSIVNQINFNQLKGGQFLESHTQFNWNFQPVMPVPFNGYYNLINRMVIPYYETPYLDVNGDFRIVPGIGRFTIANVDLNEDLQYASGIGDIIWASLIAPNKAEGWIYGLGVTLQAPTASSDRLGQGVWQAGPAAGLFYVSKQFVAGLFPQHWHSVGGTDDQHPATRFTNLQYGVSYLPTPELTIASSANILIDWTKDEANRWTVPLAIGASYLVHLGKLPVQIGVSYQWVVKHPADIEHQDSIVRLTFTPIIPSPFAKKE